MPRCPTCQSEYPGDVAFCARDGAALLGSLLEGRYRLLSPLGSGGMGVVYRAEHVALRKEVAVKVLRGELSRDPVFARRFELEAIAAGRIGHEHIVQVTDLGRTSRGELYYVMELLEGQSLAALLQREGALPLARAVPILIQVCGALEAAHARGIVHRDVKPQNVMLLERAGRPDFVKVVDFGISKVGAVAGPAERLTDTGAILGTAEYMAPEQATGRPVDARADVYAVGVLTYELVTGTPPFQGDNPFQVMLQHVDAPPEPPSRRRPGWGLPPALDALVLRCLAKAPEERPPLAGLRAGLLELAQAPAGAQAAEPTPPASARAAGPLPFAGPLEPGLAPTLVTGSASAPPGRRTGRRTAALAGAVLLVGAVAAVLGSRTQGPSPAAATEAGEARPVAPAPAPTLPAPVPQAAPAPVVVRSSPEGAQVWRGGERLGVTPLELPAGAQGPLRLTLGGHEPALVERMPEAGGDLRVTLRRSRAARPTPTGEPLEKVQDLKPNPF